MSFGRLGSADTLLGCLAEASELPVGECRDLGRREVGDSFLPFFEPLCRLNSSDDTRNLHGIGEGLTDFDCVSFLRPVPPAAPCLTPIKPCFLPI